VCSALLLELAHILINTAICQTAPDCVVSAGFPRRFCQTATIGSPRSHCVEAGVNPFVSFSVTISWLPSELIKLPVTSRFPNESKAASLTS